MAIVSNYVPFQNTWTYSTTMSNTLFYSSQASFNLSKVDIKRDPAYIKAFNDYWYSNDDNKRMYAAHQIKEIEKYYSERVYPGKI